MKKVLITGVNSYVGNSLETWLNQYPEDYQVNKVSVRGDSWKDVDFSVYDSIVHVAGIAHRKETKENATLYYEVNRDLAIDIAEKAKDEKVNQFIFLSSMSVYGVETGVIDRTTLLNPQTHYGKSKKEAEEGIRKLEDSTFKVAILRPPMIYGKNCPGNYQRLRSLALKTPIFPNIDNKRSMVYVDNLSEFIRVLINERMNGIFCPQNKEYVNTSDLVKMIGNENGRNIYLTKWFNPVIKMLKVNTVKKVFGDLRYTYDIDKRNKNACSNIIKFKESIKLTEE